MLIYAVFISHLNVCNYSSVWFPVVFLTVVKFHLSSISVRAVTWQHQLCSLTPLDLMFITLQPASPPALNIYRLSPGFSLFSSVSPCRKAEWQSKSKAPVFIITLLRCGHQSFGLCCCILPCLCLWKLKPRSVTSPTLPLPIYMMSRALVYLFTLSYVQ